MPRVHKYFSDLCLYKKPLIVIKITNPLYLKEEWICGDYKLEIWDTKSIILICKCIILKPYKP